jgi:hypothetical protein
MFGGIHKIATLCYQLLRVTAPLSSNTIKCTNEESLMGSEHFRIVNRIQSYYISIPEHKITTVDLDHALDQLVDFLSTVSSLSTLKKVHELRLRGESTAWTGELEGPQEVVGLLEVWSDGVNLVD